MAITPSDFSKIWASNADTPEYTFNEADYLKGWDFVGNLPPTRAQWNAMQKSTDEKMKYVFDNFGAPLLANTVAEMTLQNRVYVYTGSETGYTAGHWYYWNGSAWTDGGVYNAVVVQTDATLTQAGVPADAKATGDAISVKADTSIVPVVDPTLTISGAAADAKVTGDRLNTLAIELNPIAVYDGKILRKTGLADNAGFAVYQYAIPDDIESVHIKSNFYGNTFIIFTDMATDGDFSASPYQQYPSSGYNAPTTVDDDYDSKGFRYVWIPLYKQSDIKTAATYSAFELIDNNKQGIDVLNAKVEENKSDIVELQADVNGLKGLMKYPSSFNMEIGSISLYGNNDLRWTSSATRVRTLQGENIRLKSGDKITLSDYSAHRFYLYQIVSAELVMGLGWKQADFEITDEADYAIIISAVPETTVENVSDLASLLTIYISSEEDESEIPSYWDDEISASISTIQSNELLAGNRIFEFIFLTDTHWSHNAKKSPAIVEYVSNKLHINQVFGGDVVTSTHANKSDAINEIRDFYNSFQKPIISILGNHDFNPNNDTTQWLTMPECYALMLRQQEDVNGMDTFASPYYWKLDNVSQKVRLIGFRCDGINTVTTDTYNHVSAMITELDSDWNVVLLTHGFWAITQPDEPVEIAPKVQTVINVLLPVIESANANVPLWVVGHSHKDLSHTINGTTKNILVVGCNCDAYSESAVWGGETMTQGTSTEQAITCIQLDITNRKVYAVRIGAGADRTFDL